MTKKEIATTTRTITSEKAEQIVKYANKLVAIHLASDKERRKYFDAIEALRDLSDQYCEIHGLPLV